VFFIDEQPLDLQDLRDRASPSQHSPHARHELLERKRLHRVIVGAQFESRDAVGHGVSGGEKDDRQLVPLPKQPRQLKAVPAGQEHAEDRQIGRGGQNVSGVGEIVERGGGESFRAKRTDYRITYRLLILDHHDSTDRLIHRVSDCPRRFLKIG